MFGAVKRATVWPDMRMMAIVRQRDLLNPSDETQWLGHRHCGWRHVCYTCVWDTNCRWAAGVTRNILTASTLATAVNRMHTERCVLCGRDSFKGKLVLPRASVSVAQTLVFRPHSG